MSDSSTSRETWSTLLSDLNASSTSQQITLVENEDTFNAEFPPLCKQSAEREPQRLLGSFLRQHDKIIAFTSTLDELLGLEETGLRTLFWSIAFATVKAALHRKEKAIILVEPLPHLNEAFPTFGAQLPLFPNSARIQAPLQKIFREYIECYTVMLTYCISQSTPSSFQPFHDRLSSAKTLFEESRKEWENLIKQAQEDGKGGLASLPSFPVGTQGPLVPHVPTRVSFQWLGTLGHGAYGQVSKVRQVDNGRIYAQKVISAGTDARRRERIEKEVANEVSIMEKLKHHHIASICLVFRDADIFSIIMLPVADYDLRRYLLEAYRNADDRDAERSYLTRWFGCLISALAFAHSQSIKHEDIKPSNILIKNHEPVLADFGCAQDFSAFESSTNADILAFGTPVYWPPETSSRGRSADIFALGCVFSEMLTVRTDRRMEDYQRFRYLEHRENPFAFRENLPKVKQWLEKLRDPEDEVADLLIDRCLKMLQRDKADRPEAQILKMSLRRSGQDVFCPTCS